MRHWKKFLWGGLCVLSLAGFFLLWRGDRRAAAELTPQQAAQRWETEDKPYAMASVFLTPDSAVPASRMGEIYLAVENALTAGGVGSEDHPWFYAASYHTDATLKQGTVSCQVELTAVEGDFFRIHPMPLVDGWYMDEDDVMHDRIVLDRQTAWKLFYAGAVTGQYVELEGRTYQVAAVVEPETGTYNELAAGEICRAWVFADSMSQDQSDQQVDAAQPGYTCLEMVLPQPVKDFAASTLKTALGNMLPEGAAVTDNSGRFSLKSRWDILRELESRGVSSEAVPYPYWENAARLTENHLALRLVPEGILLGFPAMSLVIVLLWLNHRRTWGLHSIRDAAEELVDRKRQRDYAARQEEILEEPAVSRRQQKKALRYENRRRRGRL